MTVRASTSLLSAGYLLCCYSGVEWSGLVWIGVVWCGVVRRTTGDEIFSSRKRKAPHEILLKSGAKHWSSGGKASTKPAASKRGNCKQCVTQKANCKSWFSGKTKLAEAGSKVRKKTCNCLWLLHRQALRSPAGPIGLQVEIKSQWAKIIIFGLISIGYYCQHFQFENLLPFASS